MSGDQLRVWHCPKRNKNPHRALKYAMNDDMGIWKEKEKQLCWPTLALNKLSHMMVVANKRQVG